MPSKSLIQFSVDGHGWVPSLLFDLKPNMVEVMKIMVLSFKRPHACTTPLSSPNPAAGHCQPTPLLENPGHSQASLGQSLLGSLLLSLQSWCTQGFVCTLQESVSPVPCKFWHLYVGLMATSSKRVYATPRSASPRAPAPAAGHCWAVPLQETLKYSKAGLTQSLWNLQLAYEITQPIKN